MGRFFPWLWTLLVVLGIYAAFGFCVPVTLLLSPWHEFRDGELEKIRTLGRLSHGSLSIIAYELQPDGEYVNESRFLGFGEMSVTTIRQEDGTLVIRSVRKSNRFYKKTLRDHPEILAEAEKVLQLGREKFAKAKKKLE